MGTWNRTGVFNDACRFLNLNFFLLELKSKGFEIEKTERCGVGVFVKKKPQPKNSKNRALWFGVLRTQNPNPQQNQEQQLP